MTKLLNAYTIEEYREKHPPYGDKRWHGSNITSGIRFITTDEAEFFEVLQKALKREEISDLLLQPRFELQPKFVHFGENIRAIVYNPDFMYTNIRGDYVVADRKANKPHARNMKRKIFRYQNPDIVVIYYA